MQTQQLYAKYTRHHSGLSCCRRGQKDSKMGYTASVTTPIWGVKTSTIEIDSLHFEHVNFCFSAYYFNNQILNKLLTLQPLRPLYELIKIGFNLLSFIEYVVLSVGFFLSLDLRHSTLTVESLVFVEQQKLVD